MLSNTKEKLKNTITNRQINILITLVYFLIHLFLLSKHELWRDEAQAWAIAKNTSFVELFDLLRVEGHPIIWFLVIMPFAKMGFPFKYFGIISLVIMTASVFLFIKKSPFPIIISIFVLFSSPFFYYNAVIARVYALCVFISVIICINYKNRFEKPLLYMILVALLFQTHIKISGLAIGLSLEFLYSIIRNNRKDLCKYLMIPLTSFIFLIMELYPYGSYRQYTSVGLDNFTFDTKMKLLRGFARIANSSWGIENEKIAYSIFAIIIVSSIVGVIISIKKKSFQDHINYMIIAVCGFGMYYAITAFVHGSHAQMATIFACMVVALCWIMYESGTRINKYLGLCIMLFFALMSLSVGIKDAMKDVVSIYSYGKETSEYICESLSDDDVVLMTYNYLNPLVFSYSEKSEIQFYDVNHKRDYTFHQWSEEVDELSLDDVYDCASNDFDSENGIYYLSTEKITDKRFEEVYSNLGRENISNENYALYRIK